MARMAAARSPPCSSSISAATSGDIVSTFALRMKSLYSADDDEPHISPILLSAAAIVDRRRDFATTFEVGFRAGTTYSEAHFPAHT